MPCPRVDAPQRTALAPPISARLGLINSRKNPQILPQRRARGATEITINPGAGHPINPRPRDLGQHILPVLIPGLAPTCHSHFKTRPSKAANPAAIKPNPANCRAKIGSPKNTAPSKQADTGTKNVTSSKLLGPAEASSRK